MLLPTPLVAVVLVKGVAHWMMSGLPLLIVSPLAALLLGMSLHDAGVLALTLLLGTPTLSFLGAVGVGLTVGLKRGGVLLSLLVLPLAVPLLIFATGRGHHNRVSKRLCGKRYINWRSPSGCTACADAGSPGWRR